MKTNRFKSLWGVALSFVLLAAVPFAAQAQAEKKTNGSPEITLTIEGSAREKGFFAFSGNTIRYAHASTIVPDDITINGIAWPDLSEPFQLDFVPDFEHFIILEQEGEDSIRLNCDKNKASLHVYDTSPQSKTFRVKLAVKNQIPRETMTSDSAANHTLPSVDGEKNGKSSDEKQNTTITLEVKNRGISLFVFSKDKIYYQRHYQYNYPDSVFVNGVRWENIKEPFDLGFVPDFSSAEILEKTGNGSPDLTVTQKYFSLYVGNPSVSSSDNRIKIGVNKNNSDSPSKAAASRGNASAKTSSLNQLPNILDMRDKDYSTDGKQHFNPAMTRPPGKTGNAAENANQAVSLSIEGVIDEMAAFRIQGNKLYYLDYTIANNDTRGGLYASHVLINNRKWTNLNLPFELSFTPDFSAFSSGTIQTGNYTYVISNHPEYESAEIVILNHDDKPIPVRFILFVPQQQ